MSNIVIGSARIDEKGGISGGKAGDQTGKEVATQKFYVSSLGWDVIRAVKPEHGNKLAVAMKKYCDDNNLGYDQSNRGAILKYNGKGTTECDCSSLVRRCIIDATGTDVGNFTTATEKATITKSKLFTYVGAYNDDMSLYEGDILVTRKKGHTVIVVSGNVREVVKNTNTSTYAVGCTATVVAGALNCRQSASTKAKVVKIYHSGDRVTIKDVKVIDGNTWIKTTAGWSAAVYNKKVWVK